MDIKQELSRISGVEYSEGANLSEFSTLCLKSKGTLVRIRNEKALVDVLRIFKSYDSLYNVLGAGSNVALSEYVKQPIIVLDFENKLSELAVLKKSYKLSADVHLACLVAHAIKFELSGWEWMAGIPGTIGGAIAMNAGTAEGCIADIVTSVKIISSNGHLRWQNVTQELFSYRGNRFLSEGDIVVEVIIDHKGQNKKVKEDIKNILITRSKTQPIYEKTCGSVFKNIIGEKACLAGKCIDIMGLKGLSMGFLRISEKHGNFIVNSSMGTDEEFRNLLSVIENEIELTFGVKLEKEVVFFS